MAEEFARSSRSSASRWRRATSSRLPTRWPTSSTSCGAAVQFGIDLEPVFEEVHASNLRKVGGTKRADGKQLKPPGWTPTDVDGVLRRQRLSAERHGARRRP